MSTSSGMTLQNAGLFSATTRASCQLKSRESSVSPIRVTGSIR